MASTSLTLQMIRRLREPWEKASLGDRRAFEEGSLLMQGGAFDGFKWLSQPMVALQLQMFWSDPELGRIARVWLREEYLDGPVDLTCSLCQEGFCAHQAASMITLWQAFHPAADSSRELTLLSQRLKEHTSDFAVSESSQADGEFANVSLVSISLSFEETSPMKGENWSTLLTDDFTKYERVHIGADEESPSPRLWNLPEIFRKKLTAYSGHYLNEVNFQNRMADLVLYNFSNGQQVSAREILRHPLHKRVSLDLLPQAGTPAPTFARWPLTSQRDLFVSQASRELEEIMQALLVRIANAKAAGKIQLYLQSPYAPGKSMTIQTIEFDPVREFSWRVEFREQQDLITEIKLISARNRRFFIFETLAFEPDQGILVVHPWLREIGQLREVVAGLRQESPWRDSDMPTLELTGERAAKTVLKSLRQRSIPLDLTQGALTIPASQSRTEIRLNESGSFVLQHQAGGAGRSSRLRQGWTDTSAAYLKALSEGLPVLLRSEARELAARNGLKREWDMKILKHLGIFQYLTFEILSVHFEGTLTDGTTVEKDQIFKSLESRIQALLVMGTGADFNRGVTLQEICSKPVLNIFEEFVQGVFQAFNVRESFYSNDGEIILEGIVEREFRLIFELLRKAATVTAGEIFKKSRTAFLSRISVENFEKNPAWASGLFRFPSMIPSGGPRLQDALDSLQNLIPKGFQIFYKDQPLQELTEDEFKVDFILNSGTDPKFFNWFELNPKFFLRGEEVDADRLLSLGAGGVIEFEGKLFLVPRKQMPSLRRLEMFWRKLQGGKVEGAGRKQGEKIFQLPRSQTLELLALRASGLPIRGDQEWQRLCDFYDQLGKDTSSTKPLPAVKGELKPYQVTGVHWLQDLYQLRLGALLADDMGLGKTLQTLAFLEDLREKDELGQVLIVVPSSLVFNWQYEVEKFTPDLPLQVFSNRDRDRIGKKLGAKEQVVVIATYGLLMEHWQELSQYHWKILVFDEAQNLKNITTKRTSAARSLKASFKICLTGTPMENHFGEFYSLVDLLVPGSLGRIEEFRRRYVNSETVEPEEISDLKLKIKPLLLRRTKKEILDQLPEKQETKVSIAFEERQREIYRDIALSYNQRVQETMATQGEAQVQLQMLTALLRLRQACSDPAALPNIRYEKVPPKLETLVDSLQEIVESGESALVFTQFLQTLEHATELLKKAGLPVFVLHGGIPTKQRQAILSEFQYMQGGAVLMMTLKTGGVGLNLTKASYVFHLEPWWNPSVENQATDRAHRLGQKKAVQVFRYIMHESLEEKMELLKNRKDRRFQALFSTSETAADLGPGSSSLTKDDFDFLLGLK